MCSYLKLHAHHVIPERATYHVARAKAWTKVGDNARLGSTNFTLAPPAANSCTCYCMPLQHQKRVGLIWRMFIYFIWNFRSRRWWVCKWHQMSSLCAAICGRVGETFRGGHRPGDNFVRKLCRSREVKRIQQINWFAQSTLVACGSQTLSHRNALPPEFQSDSPETQGQDPAKLRTSIRIRLFQRLGTLKTRISSPRLWGPETHQRPKAHQILPALVNAIMSYNVNKSKFQPSWSTIMKTSAIWVRHCQNALLVFLDLFLDNLQP